MTLPPVQSPTTSAEGYRPRRWFCNVCHHILGVVVRDANRVRRLNVFARAVLPVDVSDFPALLPGAVYRVVEMNDGTVVCSHCGARREWMVGEDAFEELREKRNARRRQEERGG